MMRSANWTLFRTLLIFVFLLVATFSFSSQAKLSGSLENTISSNMYKFSSHNYSASNETSASAFYSFENGLNLSATLGVSKDLTGLREQDITDGSISASKKLYSFNDHLGLSGSLGITIPLSENSKEDRLQTAISSNLKLGYSSLLKGLKNYSLSLRTKYSQKFHEYKRDVNGSENISSSLLIGPSIVWSPLKKFSFVYSFSYINAWTHRGTRKDPIYASTLLTSYSASRDVNFTLGISDKAKAFTQYEKESNIGFIRNESAIIFLTTSVSL